MCQQPGEIPAGSCGTSLGLRAGPICPQLGEDARKPLCYESLEFLGSERSFTVFHPSFPGTGVRGPPRAIAPQSLSLSVTLSSSEMPSARPLGLPGHPAILDPPVLSPAGDKRTQFLTSWRSQWIVGNAYSMARCLSITGVVCSSKHDSDEISCAVFFDPN